MRRETGLTGENLACQFLVLHGYRILHRNIRCIYGEIDIIAYREKTIHFVEVKTRKSLFFGTPIEAYTLQKRKKIVKTGFWILHESNLVLPLYHHFQFDFIGYILDDEDQVIEQTWLENAWD